MKDLLSPQKVVGAIVLGLVGTALWDLILREIVLGFFRIVLEFSTFGIKAYRNDIYRQIAKGFYEQVSILIFSGALGATLGIGAATLTRFFQKSKESAFSSSWLKFVFLAFFVFFAATSILELSRVTYVNESISYFRQLEAAASPYLSQEQLASLNSNYAEIQSEQDYTGIISNLTNVLTSNGMRIPTAPPRLFFDNP